MIAVDFEEFFLREYPAVVRALALALGDRTRAEDAAQEGFIRALARWPRVARMERPTAWVYIVALRHERRRHHRSFRNPPFVPEPTSADPAEDVTNRATVDSLLGNLTDRQRSMVVLRFYADLSVREIGSALGCREGTVKATLHQSLAKLNRSAAEESDVRP